MALPGPSFKERKAALLTFLANGVYGDERDDLHVNICVVCVAAASAILTSLISGDPDNGVRLEKDVRAVHRGFWIDAMHLVTRVRSASEVEVLGATIFACSRRCTSHVGTIAPPQADFMEVTMANFVQFVVKCTTLGRASIWKAKFGTRGLWPTGINGILPHGPDQSTRGLLFWLLRDDEVSILLTSFCGILLLVPTQTATEILRQRQVIMSTLYTRFMTHLSRLQHSDSQSRKEHHG